VAGLENYLVDRSLLIRLWRVGFVIACCFGGIFAPALAQTAKTSKEPAVQLSVLEGSLKSRLLGRDVKFRALVPLDYDQKGNETSRYRTIYLLHGLFGHFDNWTDKSGIARYAAHYPFIIVMPEGGDGWYTDSVTIPNDRYESYIVKELIPEIDLKYRTIADREHRLIAGLSMGGYGAIKFGLKFPEMFSIVGSFSGALDAPLRDQDGSKLWATLIPVFGPVDRTARQSNDIFAILRNIPFDKLRTLPFIYLGCGTEDMFITTNRDFTSLLLEKKIPHEFRELPGKHEWHFWDQQVREFLRVANSRKLDLPAGRSKMIKHRANRKYV
jgi:putative tributyrin esterase